MANNSAGEKDKKGNLTESTLRNSGETGDINVVRGFFLSLKFVTSLLA